MTTNINVSRQRASLACDTCRSRRTKCDGRRPACSFCEQHDVVCNYRSANPPPASRQETEISVIRQRVESIYSLLSLQFGQIPGRQHGPVGGDSASQRVDYPTDESIISRSWRREFPFMTIQTPSMMCLLGLSPRLAAELVVAERTDVSLSIHAPSPPSPDISCDHAINAFEDFYNKIHYWYPILPPDFSQLYHQKIIGDLNPSGESCVVLLVAAIGSIMQCSSITEAYINRPDSCYIDRALSMIPNVHSEFSLRSVQCLVLLSIYYNCMAKPCQAHDYILMASCKAQALFKCHLYDDENATMEVLRRCFWSILLIESELGYHIDMPESNIWKFDDRILLPSTLDSWQPFYTNQRQVSLEKLMLHDSGMPSEVGKAYFLAEIAMCRMVRRCTSSVTILHDREVYAPIIAAELAHQLENWYNHLPPSIRFNRPDALNEVHSSETPSLAIVAASRALQMQYFLCQAGIYWPAVYSMIYMDTTADAPVADCARFYESYCGFVVSARDAISGCLQAPWSIYASLFITTMAALRGAQTPSLVSTVSPYVMQCFSIAGQIFETGDAVGVSPSLRMLSSILREHVAEHFKSGVY